MKAQPAVNPGSDFFPQPTHDAISRRAEELWKKYECPNGRDEEIWLEAEQQLQHEASAAKAKPVTERPVRRTSSRVGGGGSASPIPRR